MATPTENKRLVLRFYEEAWDRGELAVIDMQQVGVPIYGGAVPPPDGPTSSG